MRASDVLPDPADPGNIHDIVSPQRARIDTLIESALETGDGELAHELIVLLDMADAPFNDREDEPDHEAEEDVCDCDDAKGEADLGWLNPWGEIPHTYRDPDQSAPTDRMYLDADGDMAGGCAGEVSA